jgi:hypothetical protein
MIFQTHEIISEIVTNWSSTGELMLTLFNFASRARLQVILPSIWEEFPLIAQDYDDWISVDYSRAKAYK